MTWTFVRALAGATTRLYAAVRLTSCDAMRVLHACALARDALRRDRTGLGLCRRAL
jgi:hypothetical protein